MKPLEKLKYIALPTAFVLCSGVVWACVVKTTAPCPSSMAGCTFSGGEAQVSKGVEKAA